VRHGLKVGRADTRRIPAKMVEFKAIGDWADQQLIEHAVR
jgi:hypothetical protein